MEAHEYVLGKRTGYTLPTRFCTLGADLYAQSVFINQISASELSLEFIKSALLVGSFIMLSRSIRRRLKLPSRIRSTGHDMRRKVCRCLLIIRYDTTTLRKSIPMQDCPE